MKNEKYELHYTREKNANRNTNLYFSFFTFHF
jgi:hypothetical protein